MRERTAPGGMREDRGNRVGERGADADGEEDELDAAEVRARQQKENGERGQRGAERDRHAEDGQRRPDASELGHRITEVRQQHDANRKGGARYAVLLPDQSAEPLPGREPEPGPDFLGDGEGEHAGQDAPTAVITALSTTDGG